MVVSPNIKKINTSCYQGDLVQYNNEVCMVIGLTDGLLIEGNNYGLLALTGLHMGSLVEKNKSLTEIDKIIQGVLLKVNKLYITSMEEVEQWEN